MIDRDNVQNFHVKGKKDREHEIEEKAELYMGEDGRRTPIGTPLGMETPNVRIGGSFYVPGKSSYYGGGGMSPGFNTPSYPAYASQREFSEHNRLEELPASSPMLKTPLLVNPSTPILQSGGLSSMSPLYGISSQSIHQRSSHVRSPHYIYQGGSVSSSPNYSSLRSQSPDYNSPIGSSGRYGNSPNYSPSPMEQNRGYFKDEENDSE